MLKDEDVPALSDDLATLFKLDQGMATTQYQDPQAAQFQAMHPQAMVFWSWGDPEGKLRQYLQSAKALAAKFDADSFSVGVMIPFGVQISLTWNAKDGPEGQMRGGVLVSPPR